MKTTLLKSLNVRVEIPKTGIASKVYKVGMIIVFAGVGLMLAGAIPLCIGLACFGFAWEPPLFFKGMAAIAFVIMSVGVHITFLGYVIGGMLRKRGTPLVEAK
jgi:hypothetical protein